MFRIVWQVWIGETGKKMSKILEKQMVNDGIYEQFWISHVYMFSEKCFMIF